MPELPDVTLYLDAMRSRMTGHRLERIRLASPFLLRTAEPALGTAEGREVRALTRLGKRIGIGLEGDLWLVLHLMIAGRLHWRSAPPAARTRNLLAAFVLDHGCLVLTEAGTKKRASLHVVAGEEALASLDPGGLEVLTCAPAEFADALTRSNHTLKRALTDPRLFSGIGNAYSDEILHRARLSPVALTQRLDEAQISRLHAAVRATLSEWISRLRADTGADFPEKVTAFRPGMAVHGRYRKPCPECGTEIQRIRYAETETNYCPRCQTGGKLLADRSLSRLLKRDWPRSMDELERRRERDP